MIHQRQLLAIMFTDIVGYTALMQEDETHALLIRNKHRKIFNTLTKKYHGELIQYYGDGTLSIFKSSVEAVKCGIQMQKAFQKEPSIPVRIGIHVGDVVRTKTDIIGDAVNIASRIESIAEAGSVLISDKVNDQLKNHKDIDTKFLDQYEFKNVESPTPIYSVVAEGLTIPELKPIESKTSEEVQKPVNSFYLNITVSELKRRNVFKAAISFIVFSWVLIQAASIFFPIFGFSNEAMTILIIGLCICFPIWIVFSYIFEWTSSGFKRTASTSQDIPIDKSENRIMNRVIIVGLSIAVILLVTDRIFNFTASGSKSYSNSIAVLAFADMSPEKDQEYFSDGIREEILNLLSKIPELKVISRTSSFSFKNKEATVGEIGKALNVEFLLQGSIRKSANSFRITVQLINVADGSQVWSENYERPIENIFLIQDEIAAEVTQRLKVSFIDKTIVSKRVNPEAYTLYLRAKQLVDQISAESSANAEKLLRQSIAIDSLYAPSWELLSTVIYKNYYVYTTEGHSVSEGIEKAMPAAKKSIALDPNYAPGYSLLALYYKGKWDFEEAKINLEKALQLAPEDARIIKTLASREMDLGRLNNAIIYLKKAISLDPLNSSNYYNLANYQLWNSQNDEAEINMQNYLLMNPNSTMGHYAMSNIYLSQGKIGDALLEVDKNTHPFWNAYGKSIIYYKQGLIKEGDELLEQIIEKFGDFASPNIAFVYAYKGDKNNAFRWLEVAYENKDSVLLEVLNYPEMKNLWGDSRWNAFINKLGLPKDHGFHLD